MLNHYPRVVVLLLGLSAYAGVAPAEQTQDPSEVIRALRAEIEGLRAENQRLREQLKAYAAAEAEDAEPAPGAPVPPVGQEQPAAVELAAAAEPPLVERLEQDLEEARAQVDLLEAEKAELEKIAGVTAKGEFIESQASRIDQRFDEQADRTTVRARPIKVVDSNTLGFVDYLVGASFSFSGRAMSQSPGSYQLVLFTKANKNRRFRSFKNATLVIDGQAILLPVSRYDVLDVVGKSGSKTGRTSKAGSTEMRDEKMMIDMDPATAQRVGAATTLVLQFPKVDLELGRAHSAMVEGLRRRAAMMRDGATKE